MIKYVIALLFSANVINAQDIVNQQTSNVQVGDVFEIGKPEFNTFKHIDFPRTNFILKQGGIADYKRITGNLVEISSIKEKRDGTTEIKIKRKDGRRFFGSHTVVEVDIYEAVNSGELQPK